MHMRRARQLMRSLADETRLRIIHLLSAEELNVGELCMILGSNQSNVSKHLTRLRLTNVVGDRRDGLNVYYYLMKPEVQFQQRLLQAVTGGVGDIDVFRSDLEKLRQLKTAKRGKGRSKKAKTTGRAT